MVQERRKKAEAAAEHFQIRGKVSRCEGYGGGHINGTFLVLAEDGQGADESAVNRYILQQINTAIFRDPVGLMNNISGVTRFLREKIAARGGDPLRETLNLVPTRDGGNYYVNEDGDYWRMYRFIEDASSFDAVKSPENFYQCGKAFGDFQGLLADYPAQELVEVIPNFHHTPLRFAALKKAIDEDPLGRAAECGAEIDFAMKREKELWAAQDALAKGELPLRVTHNDTKLDNILMDTQTGKAICIIDLDTIMPGLSIFDFGDSIRFGANTALEDEQDLTKVSLSLELYEGYTKGFLEGCGRSLTEKEIRMLPMGAKLMTMECGIRFLADYLVGDTYFKIHREKHNLDRCRTQFALVADMEKKWGEMERIIETGLMELKGIKA